MKLDDKHHSMCNLNNHGLLDVVVAVAVATDAVIAVVDMSFILD